MMPLAPFDESADDHDAEPARITGISSSPKNPLRMTVKVNRRRVAVISHKHVSELGLTVGQPWTEKLAESVKRAHQYDRALQAAMTRLNRRAMSTHQLTQKLRTLKHDDETITRVIDRLTELKLLDDHAIGEALIRSTLSRKAAGPRLLRQKLRAKGIAPQTIEELLVQHAPAPDDTVTQAASLVRKKLTSMTRLDPIARKRRLWGMLARRGFDHDTIQQAIDQAIQDHTTTA